MTSSEPPGPQLIIVDLSAAVMQFHHEVGNDRDAADYELVIWHGIEYLRENDDIGNALGCLEQDWIEILVTDTDDVSRHTAIARDARAIKNLSASLYERLMEIGAYTPTGKLHYTPKVWIDGKTALVLEKGIPEDENFN